MNLLCIILLVCYLKILLKAACIANSWMVCILCCLWISSMRVSVVTDLLWNFVLMKRVSRSGVFLLSFSMKLDAIDFCFVYLAYFSFLFFILLKTNTSKQIKFIITNKKLINNNKIFY